MSVSSFAQDALRLLAGTGTERAIFVGLGFGVQVVLESYRLSPPRVLSLIGIAGAEEGPFSAMVPAPLGSFVSRSLQKLVMPVGVPVWRVVRAAWAAGLPRRGGGGQGVNPGGRTDEARPVRAWAERMARTDPHVGLRMLTSVLFYRSGRLLPQVTVPFLIVGGTEDRLVSPRRVAHLAGKIPHSRLVLLPGCSHSLMILAPARVNRVVAEFLAEEGLT